jgi:hypothetical protein
LVQRYPTDEESPAIDGLPPGEGAFLACSFWLADNYALQGRRGEAVALFERLLALRNDVGLLSEQFDPVAGRLTGNFPQAFFPRCLINNALNLAQAHGPAEHRGERTTNGSPARSIGDVWEPFFGNGSRLILTSGVSRILPVPDAALGALGSELTRSPPGDAVRR